MFTYELKAGIASNAVSIIDDDDYERTGKLLRISSKRSVESRNDLRKKLLSALISKRKKSCDISEDLSAYSKYPSALRKSLLGEGSKCGVKSTTKKRKISDRQSELTKISVAQKARSLLSLAQQLRNDSGRLNEARSARGDLLVRQAFMNAAGSGGLDFFDDEVSGMGEVERDIFSMLGGGGSSLLQSDAPGSLGRIVASLQSRGRGESSEGVVVNSKDKNSSDVQSSNDVDEEKDKSKTPRGKISTSNKDLVKECSNLYQNMMEANNECYEFERTMDAWKRLNKDSLSDFGARPLSSSAFNPTSCSKCSIPVALDLLTLILSIIQTNPEAVKRELSLEFIQQIFCRFPSGQSTIRNKLKELNKLKRVVILAIGTSSTVGSDLIWKELHDRLKSTHQEDPECAYILGQLAANSPSEKFAQLATDILEGNF